MFGKKADEVNLLKACVNGDTSAFSKIVEKYQSFVCGITLSGTGDLEQSEELAHLVFINAWKNLEQLSDYRKFKSWLTSITRNIVRNWIRKNRRDLICKAVELDEDNLIGLGKEASGGVSGEQKAVVGSALMQLPERYREVMVLYYREAKSIKLVSSELEISEEAVKTRLHRGRKMLKEEVECIVESTLERTRPGKAFTAGVIGSLSGLAIKSSSGVGAIISLTKGVFSSTGGVLSSTAMKVITAAAVVAAGVGVVISLQENEQADKNPAAVNTVEGAINVASAIEVANEVVEDEADRKLELVTSVENKKAVEPVKGLEENIAAKNTIRLGIRVLDDVNEKPITGAKLKVNMGCGCQCEPKKFVTDSKGFYEVDFGEKRPNYASVYVSADGYVPMMFAWRDKMVEEIGGEFTFYLEKGNKVGGVIVDVNSQPIEGSEVVVHMSGEESREYSWQTIRDLKAVTDANGRWEFDVFPQRQQRFSVKIRHQNFANKQLWVNDRNYKLNDFYSQNSEIVLEKGLFVEGWVTNKDGWPIKDAMIYTCRDRFDTESPNTKTDAEGRFVFEHFLPRLSRDKIVLTVIAKGYSPELKVYPVTRQFEPVLITLDEGKSIRGRVVDSKGLPIAGAAVEADNWRGHRSIKWKSNTDNEGRFVWADAPADEVEFDIYKGGYLRVREKILTAQEEEYEIVMGEPLIVSGTVVDADTNEPIEDFTICAGIEWDGGNVDWNCGPIDTKGFTGGNYTYDFEFPNPGHLLRVDADGYLPEKSRVFKSDEGSVVFDFRLKKGKGFKIGRVYDPCGVTAEGAEIYLLKEGERLHFENGRTYNTLENGELMISDEFGEFEFDGFFEDEPFKLLVWHDKGFAEVSKEQWASDPNIRLKEWGRIEGRVYRGLGVDSNVMVSCNNYGVQTDPYNLKYYYVTKTEADANGYFTADKVLPGSRIGVSRVIIKGNRTHHGSSENVKVKSGETVYVEIGGGGRTVRGRVVKPEWAGNTADIKYSILNIRSSGASDAMRLEIYNEIDMPRPDGFESMTVAEILKWYESWYDSDESLEFKKKVEEVNRKYANVQRPYNVIIGSDGSFEAIDVAPGDYVLKGQLRKAGPRGHADYSEPPVAEIEYEFSVGELAVNNQFEPVELGEIEYSKVDTLEVGSKVPDLMLRTNENETFGLADFRGSYVLVTFYNVGMDNQDEYFDVIKKLQNEFYGDGSFAMVGVTTGGFGLMEMLVEKFVEEKGLTWKQGLIDGRNYDLIQKYKVQKWPSSFMINPDGLLIDRTTKAEELYDMVYDAVNP